MLFHGGDSNGICRWIQHALRYINSSRNNFSYTGLNILTHNQRLTDTENDLVTATDHGNSQTNSDELGFFKALQQQYSRIIDAHSVDHQGGENMLSGLLALTFTSYEGTVDLQAEGQPEPDCRKGCATCCTIRVVATAPEVFLVARYLRAVGDQLKQQGIDIRQRLIAADEFTRDCDQDERVSLRQRCPYIHKGACVIYSVRPLACRSHMSYSHQACIDAANGKLDEIPYSEMHMDVRSLVQNALQSALRDADFPWATYELNHALSIALDDEGAEQAWLQQQDVLQPAQVKDVSLEEMAATFDRIMARG